MSLTVKLEVDNATMRNEQLRHLAKSSDATFRDVNHTKIVARVMDWYFKQPENVRDEIVGDLFAKNEAPTG